MVEVDVVAEALQDLRVVCLAVRGLEPETGDLIT
jgi:hypothetical protein